MRLPCRIVATFLLTAIAVLFIINGVRYKSRVLLPMLHNLPLTLFGSGGLQQQQNSTNEDEFTLVLFTTFKNTPESLYIQYNTVRSWTLLKPAVQPVLFTTKQKGDGVQMLETFARDCGWHIYPAPRVNSVGLPYVKDMYKHVLKHYNVPFVGFANGDILFDAAIARTTRTVAGHLKDTLIVGRRTDYEMAVKDTIDVYKAGEVAKLAKKGGKQLKPDAVDYLVMSGSFPWHNIPDDLVIGRPGYDNFLVSIALSSNVSVVDATKTVLAFHQTSKGAKVAKHTDNDINLDAVRKQHPGFDFKVGTASNAPYETFIDPKGGVGITLKPGKATPKVAEKPNVTEKPKVTEKAKITAKLAVDLTTVDDKKIAKNAKAS